MKSYNKLRKEIQILVLGLDNSGKTTLVDCLVGTNHYGAPTPGLIVTNINICGINLNIIDMPSRKFFYQYWHYYYEGTDAIIFMIDGSDDGRIEEVKECFQKLLKEKNLKNVPILTYDNKADLMDCLGPDEIIDKLEMYDIEGRDWAIYDCSALKDNGIKEGIKWLFEKLSE